ncbi:MAG: IclR family transcriptional regulator [Eubacteriales bacterium]
MDNTSKYEIKVLQKTLNILNCFTSKKTEWSINEFCNELDLNRTTVYRILDILKSYHYIEESQKLGRYKLGKAYIAFGSILLNEMNLKKIASMYLESLANKIEETASLSIYYDFTSLILDSYDSPNDIKVHLDIGKRSELHASSHGKIFLSNLSPTEFNKYFEKDLPQYTPMTHTNKDYFLKIIEKIRKNRVSYDREEVINGLSGIGAPILDYNSTIVGAISIVGYSNRIEKKLDQLVEQVKLTASLISKEMGFSEEYE